LLKLHKFKESKSFTDMRCYATSTSEKSVNKHTKLELSLKVINTPTQQPLVHKGKV